MIVLNDLATAHSEGKTFARYYEEESSIVTGGQDGDIRIYPGLYEDETKTIATDEKIFSFTSFDDFCVIGTEQHQVKTCNLKDSSINTVLEFTATVTHVCASSDKSWIGAGSNDFKIKLVKRDDSKQLTFSGHEAPILSLIISQDKVISSSCDGSIRIWNIVDQKCIKTVKILPITNSYENLSVMSLDETNSLIAVPVNKKVKVLSSNSLECQYELSEEHTEVITVCTWSPSARYLATASRSGEIFVWQKDSCLKKFCQHENKEITSLQWNPLDNGELLFADTDGEFGFCEIPSIPDKTKSLTVVSAVDVDDEEDVLNLSYRKMKRRANAMEEEDDEEEENVMSTKKKHRINNMDNFLDDEADDDIMNITDENNISLNLIKEGLLGNVIKKPVIEDDDIDSLSNFIVDKEPVKVEKKMILQPPFQPSSTPSHLMHRFMVWNSIGIIRCHSEDISTIDVEFHNANTHHPLHIANVMNNTMAALSTSVAVFACERQNEISSKLTCLHFGSWDNNKEWTVSMPKDENIQVVSANNDFVACATSLQYLRLFSVSGIQLQVIYLPGNIVTMVMSDRKIMAVYHKTSGFDNSLMLGIQEFNLIKRIWKVTSDETFHLRQKLILTWAGYSAEGTPVLVDSSGTVFLKQLQQNTWVPVCNVKAQVKNKSDNYWIVGVQEKSMSIRCMYCKGCSFPATLPRPVPTTVPFQMPLLDMATEKTKLEHDLATNSIVTGNLEALKCVKSFETDYEELKKKNIQLLIRLFALACKSDRDYRAIEICKLMPDVESITFAIQYASKQKKMGLANKLDQLARDKAKELEEEGEAEDEEDDDIMESDDDLLLADDDVDFTDIQLPGSVGRDTMKDGTSKESAPQSRKLTLKLKNHTSEVNVEDSLQSYGDENDDDITDVSQQNKSSTQNANVTNGNPFKVVKKSSEMRGTDYFDKLSSAQNSKHASKPTNAKPMNVSKKVNSTKQVKLSSKSIPKPNASIKNTSKKVSTEAETSKRLSGFHLYLNHQKESCKENADDEELTDGCIEQWREMSTDQKKVWNEKAKLTNNNNNNTKIVAPKSSGKDKLSSFAFGKS